jgi:formiminotetrahydrofolate cyclodeaminase
MPPEAERHRTLHEYVVEVASGHPTPGGGSVAAVVGALAAALGEMVTNLTTGEELAPARAHLSHLRTQLLRAAAEDEAAYATYRSAASLPRDTSEAKTARTEAMQDALSVATEVPIQVARAATEVAQILELIARTGNPHLRTDAALGALLAEVALRGALLNVRGNVTLLRDKARADAYLKEADQLEATGRTAATAAFHTATDTVSAQKNLAGSLGQGVDTRVISMRESVDTRVVPTQEESRP